MKRIGFIDGRRIAGFTFPATATPGNGQVITIVDPSIIASGYQRGIYLKYTSSGAKTGGTTVPYAIDLTVSGNALMVRGTEISIATSGNPTIDNIVGAHLYLDDPGSNCSALYAQRIQLYGAKASVDGIWSLRNIGAGAMNFIMQLESAGMAVYFIKQDGTGVPFVGGSYTSVHGYLRCSIAGSVCYIPLYT